MSADDKEDLTFNDDQRRMFEQTEEHQAGAPTRPRTPGAAAAPLPDVDMSPPPQRAAHRESDEPHIVPLRGEGGTEITGGTDKYGPGGMAGANEPAQHDTGARETGDIAGASTTHAGAGGALTHTGGVGTAPNEVNSTGDES